MAASFEERYNSRRLKRGPNPSFSIEYIVVEEDSEYAATELVLAGIDPTANIDDADYPITSAEAEPLADDIWVVTITYGQSQGNILEPEQISLSFDTTGGRAKVTHSLATTAYVSSGTAPDNNGAVAVTSSGIEGAEVTIPALSRSVKRQLPPESVTNEYINALADLTGNYNSDAFMGRAAGEVRFDGATGDQQQVGAAVDVTYKFTISPNATGLTVAGITGISKLGWQFLWILFEEYEDTTAKRMAQQAVAVYVEDLPNCQPKPFASTLGFTVS